MGEFVGKVIYFLKDVIYFFSSGNLTVLLEHVGMRKKEKIEHISKNSNKQLPSFFNVVVLPVHIFHNH